MKKLFFILVFSFCVLCSLFSNRLGERTDPSLNEEKKRAYKQYTKEIIELSYKCEFAPYERYYFSELASFLES